MADAEQERLKMASNIDRLELEKQNLEAVNARTIEESRNLLDQLEGLSNAVSESDTHIQSLNETLLSTQLELQRLTVLAARTSQLEADLLSIETQNANLQHQLESKDDDQRMIMQRWQYAERTIGELHEQVEKIEKESREENERHVEVLARMERQRAVEKELDGAANRLKRNSGVVPLEASKNGSNVVSHFVKDILQDNSNLQAGIVQLRDMLMRSNEEVEDLRERMLLHQPVTADDTSSGKSTLRAELVNDPSLETTKELHVHHHYHGPARAEPPFRERMPIHRRAKKKRGVITPGVFSPTSRPGTIRSSASQTLRQTSALSATILSQTSVTVPPVAQHDTTHRWSKQSSQTQSSFAPSSIPSSPLSMYRNSSVFDYIDATLDSSRPTSPESTSLDSPMGYILHQKDGSDGSSRSFSTPIAIPLKSPPLRSISDVIHEFPQSNETESHESPVSSIRSIDRGATTEADVTSSQSSAVPNSATENDSDSFYSIIDHTHPALHRSISHESLLSISGMDIHTLHHRPSQMFVGQGFTPRSPITPSPLSASSKPVTTNTTATGRPAYQAQRHDSRRALLSSHLVASRADHATTAADKLPLGKRVGGWVWGKWGVAPMASVGDLRSRATKGSEQQGSFRARPPGVNQPGVIWGLRGPVRTPSNVEPREVDCGLLRESLVE
ncbi:hypothetical protein MMC20_005207 [Loxospora ochrophaea]|nr:hypothetical protein [Loxospora ochrophaea]